MRLTTPRVEARYRYEVGDKIITAADAPTINMTADSELKFTFRGRFYDYRKQEIDFLTNDLKVIASINGDEYNLGYYVITGETLEHEKGVDYIEIEGYSRLYLLKQSRIETRVYFAANTLYTEALYDLLTDAGITAFYIEPSELTLATDREDWEIGTDRLTIINKLLSEMSYASAWVDLDGVIQCTPAKIPSIENIDIIYQADRYSIIGADYTMAVDRHNKPNVFRVVCNNPELDEPLVSIIENDDEDNPYSTAYRPRVLQITEVDNIASQEALDEYAYQLALKSLLSDEVVTYETMLNPEHTVGDIVALGNGDLTGIFVETGWSMTLDYQARMTHRARRTVGFKPPSPDETDETAGKELSYYGTATSLSGARYYLAGASISNAALFAGGQSPASSVVDAYDATLTRTIAASLLYGRYFLASSVAGNKALFAGGDSGSTSYATVDAYDTELTRSNPAELSQGRGRLAGAQAGNYALFAGGYSHITYGSYSTVDAYDAALSRISPPALTSSRYYLAGGTLNNCALFAGGVNNSDVNVYDDALTRTSPTGLSVGRYALASASTVDYILFAGGKSNSGNSNVVDAYDATFTRNIPTGLSVARTELAGVSIAGFAIFAGGYADAISAAVDVYDDTLSKTTFAPLSVGRYGLTGAKVGNYALVAGGSSTGGNSSVVDVFIVA